MGKDWRGSVLLSMPTFGYIHVSMFSNLKAMEVPIHRSVIWHLPVDMPVDEARNKAVEKAIEIDAEFLFFRDYDVLAPLKTLSVLIARDVDVIGGLYCSKQKPPAPLIIKDNRPTMSWPFGDVVRCDGIGMGCTLIKTELFKKMEPPWFKTICESDENVPLSSYTTEDMYFCNRIRDELDIYPHCDTSMSCVHVDFDTGDRFFFDTVLGGFVWQPKDESALFIPPVDHPGCRVSDITTKESEKECESS